MKTYSQQEVDDLIQGPSQDRSGRPILSSWQSDYDNEGQVIIYTGVFRWSDGTYHDVAEEEA